LSDSPRPNRNSSRGKSGKVRNEIEPLLEGVVGQLEVSNGVDMQASTSPNQGATQQVPNGGASDGLENGHVIDHPLQLDPAGTLAAGVACGCFMRDTFAVSPSNGARPCGGGQEQAGREDTVLNSAFLL
jgi:hypothetical protein